MDRPSFQFYPGDWLGNKNLRRCTPHERGIWMDVMCLLHDSEEYGVLRWPLSDVTQAVAGCTETDLQALRVKGVLKGSDVGERCEPFTYVPTHARTKGSPVTLVDAQPGPIWYSSRMVKDEYLRKHRGEGGRFKEAHSVLNEGSPIHRNGERIGDNSGERQGDGSSSSSSSSFKEEEVRVCEPDAKSALRPFAWRAWYEHKRPGQSPRNQVSFDIDGYERSGMEPELITRTIQAGMDDKKVFDHISWSGRVLGELLAQGITTVAAADELEEARKKKQANKVSPPVRRNYDVPLDSTSLELLRLMAEKEGEGGVQ